MPPLIAAVTLLLVVRITICTVAGNVSLLVALKAGSTSLSGGALP